jgi:hypothetical protein
MTRRTALSLVFVGLSLAACDPSDPCDPGYYSDHFFCLQIDASVGFLPDEDAGGPDPSKNTAHGTPCSKPSDCGGEAPVCGAPQLPVCTTVECLVDGKDMCPSGWTCLDVTRYAAMLPVTSVCVMLP